MRHSPFRNLAVPFGFLLLGLAIYNLIVDRSIALAAAAFLTGLALVTICAYDAPPTLSPNTMYADAPPGTSRRAAIAFVSLALFMIGAALGTAIMGWPPWLIVSPLAPIFLLVTVFQARAEGVSTVVVLRRASWPRK